MEADGDAVPSNGVLMEVRYIRWIDSNGGEGWTNLSRLRTHRPCVIHSVGFVMSEDEEHVSLLQSFDVKDDPAQVNGDNWIAIPKVAVLDTQVIGEVDGP